MFLKVSRSGYYKYYSNTGVSVSSIKRAAIAFHARVFHKIPEGIYGYREVHEDFEKELPITYNKVRKFKSAVLKV